MKDVFKKKMHKLLFPKNVWRPRAPRELVHANIFSPTRTSLLNGRRYFILFVDDYTQMMWSEIFTTFL